MGENKNDETYDPLENVLGKKEDTVLPETNYDGGVRSEEGYDPDALGEREELSEEDQRKLERDQDIFNAGARP